MESRLKTDFKAKVNSTNPKSFMSKELDLSQYTLILITLDSGNSVNGIMVAQHLNEKYHYKGKMIIIGTTFDEDEKEQYEKKLREISLKNFEIYYKDGLLDILPRYLK